LSKKSSIVAHDTLAFTMLPKKPQDTPSRNVNPSKEDKGKRKVSELEDTEMDIEEDIEMDIDKGKMNESEREDVGEASGSSVIATQSLFITDINGWSTEQVIQHLQTTFPNKLTKTALDILREQEIEGTAFLTLTGEKLERYGMKGGPASIIAGYVKGLNSTVNWKNPLSIRQWVRHLLKPLARSFLYFAEKIQSTPYGTVLKAKMVSLVD